MSKVQWIKENLKDGEQYAGILLGAAPGEPDQHIILLSGAATDVTWNQAKDWAAKAGGELPTRREQSLLFANLKAEFEPKWYWSGEQYASYPENAWFQIFVSGNQLSFHKSFAGRARAVRRLPI